MEVARGCRCHGRPTACQLPRHPRLAPESHKGAAYQAAHTVRKMMGFEETIRRTPKNPCGSLWRMRPHRQTQPKLVDEQMSAHSQPLYVNP